MAKVKFLLPEQRTLDTGRGTVLVDGTPGRTPDRSVVEVTDDRWAGLVVQDGVWESVEAPASAPAPAPAPAAAVQVDADGRPVVLPTPGQDTPDNDAATTAAPPFPLADTDTPAAQDAPDAPAPAASSTDAGQGTSPGTGVTPDPAQPVSAPSSEPTGTPDPAGEHGPAAAGDRPVYEHLGDDPVDSDVWPAAGLLADDGAPLYRFSGDTDSSATGVSQHWAVYTGTTHPVAAADAATSSEGQAH